MDTGGLTPRTNDTISAMRFTGAYGQPDGFGSVLTAAVKMDGRLVLTLVWRDECSKEHMWTVELGDSQRNAFAALASKYQPRLYEKVYD